MRNKKLISIFLVSALCLTTKGLFSEVQQVTITWNNVACNQKCAEVIEKNFRKMNQVQKVKVAFATGTTELEWKPKSPFSFQAVKMAMQMSGVGINDLRVKVRGKAKEKGGKIALVSLEDNTPFILISPIDPKPEQYTTKPNPYFRELTPDLRERILQEIKEDKILVIEGPLYQPGSSPPLQLIVERILIEKKKN